MKQTFGKSTFISIVIVSVFGILISLYYLKRVNIARRFQERCVFIEKGMDLKEARTTLGDVDNSWIVFLNLEPDSHFSVVDSLIYLEYPTLDKENGPVVLTINPNSLKVVNCRCAYPY